MTTGESRHVPHWEYQLAMKKSGTEDSAVPFAASGSSPFKVKSIADIIPGKPVLTDEAMGWLAYLNRRVDFGGTWFKDDAPHASWDNLTGAPIGNYYRYDLTYLTFALGIMADQTPAWRELYTKILDFTAQRFLEYWSLFDWIERRGADPDRDNYPDFWYDLMIPAGFRGKYDAPGWAANGLEPFEYDPDPVRGNGSCNVMYKGYLDLVLGFYAYVSGSAKYDEPFKVTYDDSLVFEYDYVKLNELIAEQFYNTWTGLSCEVTKSYGWCNNLTGLSLKLFDITHGTHHTLAYQNWKRYFRENYLGGGTGSGPIEWYTLLYDMSADINLHGEEHQFAYNWMGTIWNGLPLDRRLFERMYDGAMQRFFTPQGDGSAFMIGLPGMEDDYPYATITALSASRELGDDERMAGLRSWAMKQYQPTWDAGRGEFYHHFALEEPWPRAQYNDWIMPAFTITEPGQWARLFNRPNLAKFRQPTVEGIDYPTVRPRQAYWDADDKALVVAITSCDTEKLGDPTSFRVTNLVPGGRYRLTVDGVVQSDVQPADGTLSVDTRVGTHTIVLQQLT